MENSSRRNPYIIGRPINEQELFFGRKSVFRFIEDNLKQGMQVILLPGERRIGKSSLLQQIPNFVTLEEFVFVPFDLEYHNCEPLSRVLQSLATDILGCLNYLKLDLNQVKLPNIADLEKNINIFTEQFLPQVYKALGSRKLALLLDEFDISTKEDSNSAFETFFPYLRSIINLQDQLFIIVCLGRQSSDMPKLLNLFKGAPSKRIDLLDNEDAKALITQPAQGILKYSERAIQKILKLSAGHPYFTQIICFTIFGQARNQENWNVTRNGVESIVDKAIESAEGGLSWLWDGLSIPEKVVFTAVAETQKKRTNEEPFKLLANHGIQRTETLSNAEIGLVENGLLDENKNKIKIELVRLWVIKRHPFYKEIGNLEYIEQPPEIQLIYEEATKLYQEDNKKDALELYTQVLDFNPNNFISLLALAEGDLEVENFGKAVERYTRAYQVDPLRNKEKLLQAREKYAQKLITEGDLEDAKKQYQEVLKVEPERLSTKQKLKVVEALLIGSKGSSSQIVNSNSSKESALIYSPQNTIAIAKYIGGNSLIDKTAIAFVRRLFLQKELFGLIIIFGAILAVVSGLAILRLSTPCRTGETKEFGIYCQRDTSISISRGERTLFPTISNTNRNKGIEAYKQGDYSQAAKFFNRAVQDGRNDPEVLIYKNNALARNKGSWITLAVVVPVNNADKAQEILRGVAQAQNEFNNNNGLNGRLLEIAIVNSTPKQIQTEVAKKLAQELVKDQDILGVIGHDSSDAMKVAINEYEKAKLAIISPTSSSIFLNNSVFFRTVPSEAASAKKLAEYAINSGLQKVVIFSSQNSEYINTLKNEFQRNFKQKNGQVVKNQNLDTGEAIPVSQSQAQAAVLFPDTAHIPEALQIAKLTMNPENKQQQGLKLLGGDTLYNQDTLDKGQEAVEGLVLAVPWFRDAPQSQKFAETAQQQWGAPVSWRTATSYDATQAFIQAIKSISTNLSRETILKELQKIELSPSETSGEPLKFTPNRERQSEPVLVQVKGGKFTIVNKAKMMQ